MDPTTRARLRLPRWLILTLAALVTGAGLMATGIATAQPAQAVIGCQPDQVLPEIAGDPMVNVGYVLHRYDGPGGREYAAIHPAGGALPTYPSGHGMSFSTFAHTACQVGDTTLIAVTNVAWSWLVMTPLRIVGAIFDFALGGKVIASLLGGVETAITALHENFFLTWAPPMMCAALIIAVIRLARGRQQHGLGGVAWMVTVLVGIGVISTPAGLGVVRDVNDWTATITRSAFLGTAAQHGQTEDLSAGIIEALVASTWAHGAMGSVGNAPAPAVVTAAASAGVPDIASDVEVVVPVAAIPAATPGEPTWAEVLRWTHAYTAQESAALTRREEAVCAATTPPETIQASDPSWGDPENLCTYKWLLRSAILRHFEATDATTYAVLRGAVTEPAMTAVGTGMAVVPAMIALSGLGLVAIVAELAMLMYLAMAPVIGLAALVRPTMLRSWAEQLTSTLITRVAVGAGLGLVLWMLLQVQALVDGRLLGIDVSIPAPLRPIAVGILGVGIVIAAARIIRDIGQWLRTAAGVTTPGIEAQAVDRVAGAGKALGLGAIGAVGGVVAAGQGARLAGGAMGMMRGAHAGGLGAAVTGSAVAGRMARHSKDAAERHARDQRLGDRDERLKDAQLDAAAHEASVRREHDEQDVRDAERARTDAWRRAMQTPELADEALAQQHTAATAREDAVDRLVAAQLHRDDVVAQGPQWVAQRTDALVGAGMTRNAAEEIAGREQAARVADAEATVETADAAVRDAARALEDAIEGVGTRLAEEIREALDAGVSADDVARDHGLATETLEALRAYEDTVARARAAQARLEGHAYDYWE